MLHTEALGLLLGAVALGAVHGVEPGHGWPVAASYALNRSNKWVYGFAASVTIGVGHLVSSIAMVGAFFYAKAYFDLAAVNEPITVLDGVRIGGPVSLVAGVLLVLLGVREYVHGHGHGQGRGHDGSSDDAHDHGHDHHHDRDREDERPHEHGSDRELAHDHGHRHAHDHDRSHGSAGTPGDPGIGTGLRGFLPFVGSHSHPDDGPEEAAERGLLGIAWFAFVLGFAHEEEFEIIALCAGSEHCLELMGAYALTVLAGIVGLTMLLIAGYQRYEERVERYTPYLPMFSAVVLVGMGLGFVTGLF